MSAETDLQALLEADAGVLAALGAGVDPEDRIVADRVEQGTGRPFAVYTRTATERMEGLDGTVHAKKVTFDLQCWGDTRAQAEALADACEEAIHAAGQAITGRSTGYDSELDMEAALLSVEWWE